MPPFKMKNNKKIKVLRIINRFNIGGPTYNAVFLSRYLGDEYETLLIGGRPEEGETDSLHICEAYDVEPILIDELTRNPNFSDDAKAFLRIRKIINEYKPDIVHTHAAKAGAIGRFAAWSCGVPVRVHTFHGHVFHSYFGRTKTTVFKWIERFLARLSTQIVVISPLQQKEIVLDHKIVSAKKTTVVPLGFDLQNFQLTAGQYRKQTREIYNIQEDEIAIAIIGRLTAIKNHTFLIDVLDDVQKMTNKKIRFFIVGDGELRTEIEQFVASKKWKEHIKIEFTSWIKQVNEFVPAMDIVALCSLNEGTPVSLIEAQAANVAVISNDVGGVRDVVADEKTGCIVTKLDKLEYTNKLFKLIDDDVTRESFRRNGWDFVSQKYHYNRLADDISQLYKRLLKHEN